MLRTSSKAPMPSCAAVAVGSMHIRQPKATPASAPQALRWSTIPCLATRLSACGIPMNTTVSISPAPPVVADELPHIGAGLRFMENPTAFLKELREQYGDTFLVDVFGYQLFCVFSPAGLESLYKLEEEKASFALATFDLLGFKTPSEVFADVDIKLFYDMLVRKNLPGYLDTINEVLGWEIERLGDSGEADAFDLVRTLEQRVGYGVWIGKDAASEPHWQVLKKHFDVLDQERAFVDPALTLATIKSGKAAERQALAEIHALLKQLWQARSPQAQAADSTMAMLYQRFSERPEEERFLCTVHNIVNTNQGFLSNLYAGIAWVLINILQYPEVMARIQEEIARSEKQYGKQYWKSMEALDGMLFMEQVLMESVRLAQRSITLRKVLAPIDFSDANTTYHIPPGVYVTTLLSVTNTQTPALASFDADRYEGSRLSAQNTPAGKETVSTFGHGKHACPAKRFSLMMCKAVIIRLLENFHFEPLFQNPAPSSRQLGGVARSHTPALLRYTRSDAGAKAALQ